jgi:hypothetical protein
VTKVLRFTFIIIYLLLVSRLSGHETVAQDSRLKNQETFQFLSSQMEKTSIRNITPTTPTTVLTSC